MQMWIEDVSRNDDRPRPAPAHMNSPNSTPKQPSGTGLLLPSREVLLWKESDLAVVVEAARRAETSGYDSVWVGDSRLARPRGEPLTLLAALAGSAKRRGLRGGVDMPRPPDPRPLH